VHLGRHVLEEARDKVHNWAEEHPMQAIGEEALSPAIGHAPGLVGQPSLWAGTGWSVRAGLGAACRTPPPATSRNKRASYARHRNPEEQYCRRAARLQLTLKMTLDSNYGSDSHSTR